MNLQEEKFSAFAPIFYSLVKDFPDFHLSPPLDEQALRQVEKTHSFQLPDDLKTLFKISSGIHMNGLSLDASKMGSIILPDSDALVIAYFNLYNAADRLMLKAGDPAIYYLEQHNGAITKLAANTRDFLEKTLPKYL